MGIDQVIALVPVTGRVTGDMERRSFGWEFLVAEGERRLPPLHRSAMPGASACLCLRIEARKTCSSGAVCARR